MYQALYRKYRPQTFDEVVGQRSVTDTLRSQVETGRLSHAYLFTGTRGTGKTSCARILAKAVNCLQPQGGNPCNRCENCRSIDSGACVDVLEIDAASNNGVDHVRALRDEAVYSPSQAKKRVYVIDEVHMLSASAFNALLKIIEEPPEHVLFILATTELQKVPATILSRCQRYSFRRLRAEDIADRLQSVAYQEKIDLEEDAAVLLSHLADGGLRDGLSLLDQCASASQGAVTRDAVCAVLGLAGEQKTGDLLEAIAKSDAAAALTIFSDLYAAGKDLSAMLGELSSLARDLLVAKTAPSLAPAFANVQQRKALAQLLSPAQLLYMIDRLQRTLSNFAVSTNRRLDAELCLMELCQPELTLDAQSLSARIGRLEEQIASGVPVKQAPKKAPAPKEPKKPAAPQKEAAPAPQEKPAQNGDALPPDFWPEFTAKLASVVPPAQLGLITAKNTVTPYLKGDRLILVSKSSLLEKVVGTDAALLDRISQTASALLGRQVRVSLSDTAANLQRTDDPLNSLLGFGNAHSDIIQIK